MNAAGATTAGLALAVAHCQAQPPATTPVAPEVSGATEGERGPPLDLSLPLYGEGAVPLSSLRGKLVVLDLFLPAEPGWYQAHAAWRTLAEQHPADVVFVAVAVAGTGGAVDAWDVDPPSHLVAADPQGALALRLGAQALPTVLILDRRGRLIASGVDRAAMRQTANALLLP